VEDPEAVRKLHHEFLRTGADVMQAFTFYASKNKPTKHGNKAGATIGHRGGGGQHGGGQAGQGGEERVVTWLARETNPI
jgi:hypothetical protein